MPKNKMTQGKRFYIDASRETGWKEYVVGGIVVKAKLTNGGLIFDVVDQTGARYHTPAKAFRKIAQEVK